MPKRQLDISDIQALGFDVEEVRPRVFAVKDFLSPEEVDLVFNEINSYSEEHWRHRYMDEMRQSCIEKFGHDNIEQLVEDGLLEVTWNFADKNSAYLNADFAETMRLRAQQIFDVLGGLQLNGFLVAHRLYEGSDLKEHFDQYSDKLIEYAGVLYVNKDYTDGELFFSKLDLELQPEPGTLMIFPGTEEFTHGVRPVGAGPVRYNLPTFIKRLDPGGAMAGWANFG
jgi:hypothetical protein